MNDNNAYNPLYGHDTIEFVTVAVEFCAFIEHAEANEPQHFTGKAVKILPLLYLKATMLPDIDVFYDELPPMAVTEDDYNAVCNRLATLLGTKDSFLDTFVEDMKYSDTPIASHISECLADVYQDIANFIAFYRTGTESIMQQGLALCSNNFRHYWGQQLLNALKALHSVHFSDDNEDEEV